MIKATVRGDKELSRTLRKMQRQVAKVLKDATLKSCEPIVDTAQLLAPRRQYETSIGHMADSIRAQVVKSTPTRCIAHIGPDKDHWYGRFQETGTVNHAANPFLRPALEGESDKAVQIFGQELAREIKP